MKEVGIVSKIQKDIATVEVDKKDECSKCGMCLFPQGVNAIAFNANNKVGAKLGDTVVIERYADGGFLSAVLVFLVPLILIGLSVFLGLCIIKWQLSVLILSLSLIILWYIILSKIDKILKRKWGYKTVVVEILRSNNNE
ncbi:MAG: hypothetical protein E7348_04175 [Clostridiales bacterium]|nr:hypothetical protein [Clostridiales bacterium]